MHVKTVTMYNLWQWQFTTDSVMQCHYCVVVGMFVLWQCGLWTLHF